jgi:hypothetical protein
MICKSCLLRLLTSCSYVEHCHPFLPIVDIGRPQAFEVVRESPALICSIAAVASRFYHGYLDRTSGADLVINGFPSDSSLPTALANLAEEHLSDILLHKRHTLADVQAILLLAAWGLRSGGGGPDAWVISGHASRVGMRLGLHQPMQRLCASKVCQMTSMHERSTRWDQSPVNGVPGFVGHGKSSHLESHPSH